MVRIIAGLMGSSVAAGSTKMSGAQQLAAFLSVLKSHNVNELDTARVYNSGKSEEDLGDVAESKTFEVHTKAPGFSPGSLSYEKVIANCNASLEALKREKIELYYFHGPDRTTPLEESCKAINQLHQEGKIERFGGSNFSRDEVEEIVDICQARGWLKPSVYQGGYNPLGRSCEEKLMPTLREHGMAFYAYSPLAGGYFSRPSEQLRNPPAGGRMAQMKVFSNMYVNDLTLRLHDVLTGVCEQEGIVLKEATLRYLSHHSVLGAEDGIILGASSKEQMEENLKACEAGPLPGRVVAAFEDLWTEYRQGGYDPPYCV